MEKNNKTGAWSNAWRGYGDNNKAETSEENLEMEKEEKPESGDSFNNVWEDFD